MSMPFEIPETISNVQPQKLILLNKERIVKWAVQWLLYKTYPTQCELNWA